MPADGPLRLPFAAPIRVATIGDRCIEVSRALQTWKGGTEPIDDGALTLLHVDQVEDSRFEPPQQVIVVHDHNLRSLLGVLGRSDRPGERLPRLVVCVRERRVAPYLSIGRLPRGVALLMVPQAIAASFMPALLEEIGKDMSMERASFRAADRWGGQPGTRVELILDDSINQSLRFQDLEDMARIEALLVRANYQRGPGAELPPPSVPVVSGRDAFRNLAKLRSLSVPSTAGSGFDELESRALDINVLRGTYRAGLSRLLDRGTTLLNGADYFLHIHIGRMLPSSIVKGQYGEEEYAGGILGNRHEGGQLLEVVLQEKGFELRTARSQFVYLPRRGPSAPVMLGIHAPQAYGAAELRISVYLRNQPVQAVLIRAEIADQEYRLEAGDRGVVGKLEFTQTDGFKDLAQLPERALSVTVNSDGAQTHTLLVKGELGAFPFSVPESLVRASVKKYRDLLEHATTPDGTRPRFPAGEAPDPADSNEFLSRLADLGSDLYNGCFYEDDDSVRSMLRSVRESSDRIISVVWHDPRFAFPWQIFYDYQLPIRFYGITPKVCRGVTESGPCGHTHKDKVYCVRGFWGYRHQVEEMIGTNGARRISTVEHAAASPVLGYLISTKDVCTEKLIQNLDRRLGDNAASLGPAAGFLDKLAEGGTRPPIVMLLGHLEQSGDSGPVGPRLVLERNNGSPSAWLVGRELANRFRDSPWQQPHAIVMLMACESAATGPETLYDFVMALHRARAGAIVGVECRAFSGLLSAFGEDVTLALCNQTPLGQAMLDFRRKMLQRGDPLGFIFTGIGCADVQLKRATT